MSTNAKDSLTPCGAAIRIMLREPSLVRQRGIKLTPARTLSVTSEYLSTILTYSCCCRRSEKESIDTKFCFGVMLNFVFDGVFQCTNYVNNQYKS